MKTKDLQAATTNGRKIRDKDLLPVAQKRGFEECHPSVHPSVRPIVVPDARPFYSVNNRRLCLDRLCEHLGLITHETAVKVQLLENHPPRFAQKFTTPCNGKWVRVRRDGRICGETLSETTFGREEFFVNAYWSTPLQRAFANTTGAEAFKNH